MQAGEFLALKRAQLAAELDLIDRLIREAGGAAPAHPAAVPATVPAARPEPTPGPKAERPDSAGQDAGGYAQRVAAALLDGPLSVPAIERAAGISYPTVMKQLKSRPDWFFSTGQRKATRWELTPEGRQAAQAASEG